MDSVVFNACLENSLLDIRDKKRETWEELAKKFGYKNGNILRKRFNKEKLYMGELVKEAKDERERLQEIDGDNIPSYRESEEIKSDGTIISDKLIEICEIDSKDPIKLLVAHKFDPEKFELVSAKNNMWHMLQKGVGRTILYQSKITVKPKIKQEIGFDDIDKFFSEFRSDAKSIILKTKNYSKNGKILEIDLADMHVGNAGVFDDEDSIEKKCSHIINEIIDKCKNIKLEKILLVNLGDWFHYDTYKQTTTGGTNVTSYMDFATIFDTGAKMFIDAIDKLVQIAPVEVVGIFGNHDRISLYMLIKAIEFYYRNNDFVQVDTSHLPRKFRKFGNCLVLWNHGDMSKNNAYSLIQREARKEFGETKFAEIHSGHFHSQRTEEKDGVIIRYLPTLTPTDSWHFDNGFTGAVRSTVSFLWDKENGLEEMWFINV